MLVEALVDCIVGRNNLITLQCFQLESERLNACVHAHFSGFIRIEEKV